MDATVHTDVHEMGYDSPYFFPPSAGILKKYQKIFITLLVKISKKDAQNWMYNTGAI
jgi:hypothetical protein